MSTPRVRIVPNARGIRELETDLAYGVFGVVLYAEAEAKREAPVRGGYRSFRPGSSPIGGTLRRSIHAVCFDVDGSEIGRDNETGADLPADYAPEPGKITGFMGTNSGYGGFVELGTSKMPPRAHVAPGLDAAMAQAPTIIRGVVDRRRGSGR